MRWIDAAYGGCDKYVRTRGGCQSLQPDPWTQPDTIALPDPLDGGTGGKRTADFGGAAYRRFRSGFARGNNGWSVPTNLDLGTDCRQPGHNIHPTAYTSRCITRRPAAF